MLLLYYDTFLSYSRVICKCLSGVLPAPSALISVSRLTILNERTAQCQSVLGKRQRGRMAKPSMHLSTCLIPTKERALKHRSQLVSPYESSWVLLAGLPWPLHCLKLTGNDSGSGCQLPPSIFSFLFLPFPFCINYIPKRWIKGYRGTVIVIESYVPITKGRQMVWCESTRTICVNCQFCCLSAEVHHPLVYSLIFSATDPCRYIIA